MTRPAPERVTIRSAFSRALKSAREDAGFSRTQLAQEMGYTNLSKGASKLAIWERGDDLPRGGQRPRLAAALPKVTEAMRCAIEAEQALNVLADREIAASTTWERQARAHEAGLVIENLEALSTLLATPEGQPFTFTPLPFAALQLAYLGGRMLRLGEVVSLWRDGRLHATCPCHDQAMPVMSIAGSPLSGTHTLTGLCSVTGEAVRGRQGASTLLAFVRPLLSPGNPKRMPGPCLERALEAAGCDVPPIQCFHPDGSLFATWHPSTRRLDDADGALLASLKGDQEVGVWRDLRGPARDKGTPVIGTLAPLSFGAWRGSRLVVTPHPQHRFFATSGHLRGADEAPKVRWTRQPPPWVVAWLAEHLDCMSRPGC